MDLITFNGNRVVGTISIPLSDVVAECGTTGMGYFVKDYYLSSPDGGAIDALVHTTQCFCFDIIELICHWHIDI